MAAGSDSRKANSGAPRVPGRPILQLPTAQYAEQNALAQNTRSKKSSRKVSAHAANAGLERLPKELRAVGPLPDISKLLTAIVAEAWRLWIRLHPGSNPQAPLPPGTVGPEVPINPQAFGLTITAAATQDNQGFIVWQKEDSELLVVTGKVTVSLDDGLVLISFRYGAIREQRRCRFPSLSAALTRRRGC